MTSNTLKAILSLYKLSGTLKEREFSRCAAVAFIESPIGHLLQCSDVLEQPDTIYVHIEQKLYTVSKVYYVCNGIYKNDSI